jgi:hypothetical protein
MSVAVLPYNAPPLIRVRDRQAEPREPGQGDGADRAGEPGHADGQPRSGVCLGLFRTKLPQDRPGDFRCRPKLITRPFVNFDDKRAADGLRPAAIHGTFGEFPETPKYAVSGNRLAECSHGSFRRH